MSGIGPLVRHSLRRRRGFLGAVASTLFLFQIVMIAAGRALYKSGMLSQLGQLMPSFLEEFTNMAALSFRGLVSFGYSHPVVEFFLTAMAIGIGTEPAAEIESKFVDLLMARPIRRIAAINRSIIVLLVATFAAIGSMLIGTAVGLQLLTPPGAKPPGTRLILSLGLNLAALVLAWGAIALAVASGSRRRTTAAAICGLLAFVTFVADYVGRIWEAVKPVAIFSPFHYYNPFPMLGGAALSVRDVAVLIGIFVAGAAIANLVYVRRDL